MFDGKQIGSGTIGVDRINATGTPTSSNFLRGDGTWNAPAIPTTEWTKDGAGNLYDSRVGTITLSGANDNTIIGYSQGLYLYNIEKSLVTGYSGRFYNYSGTPGKSSNNIVWGYNFDFYGDGNFHHNIVIGSQTRMKSFGVEQTNYNAIIGGYLNHIISSSFSGIIAGENNYIYGDHGFIGGGSNSAIYNGYQGLIAVKNFTAAMDANTVGFPKIRLGLGTSGALPTSGEINSLGLDSLGVVIKTGLSFSTTASSVLSYPAPTTSNFNGIDGITNGVNLAGQDIAEIFDFITLNVLDTGRTSTGAAHFLRFQNDGTDVFSLDTDGNAVVESLVLANDTKQIIKTAHIQLTQGQIQALNTTSIEIAPQPASGEYLQILGASAYINHNGTTYSVASELRLVYQGITATILAESIATFIDSPGDVLTTLQNGAVGAKQITLNKALHVHADANATGAGGTIDVYVQYAIINTV